MIKSIWLSIFYFQKASPSWMCRKKIATIPRVLEMNPIIIDILKLHEPEYLDKYILFPKGVSFLKAFPKVQEKTKQVLLGFWRYTSYIIFWKNMIKGIWISIFYFQRASPSWRCIKKEAITPNALEMDSHNYLKSEISWTRAFGKLYFISKGRLPPEGEG